jgi:hypothetical protein
VNVNAKCSLKQRVNIKFDYIQHINSWTCHWLQNIIPLLIRCSLSSWSADFSLLGNRKLLHHTIPELDLQAHSLIWIQCISSYHLFHQSVICTVTVHYTRLEWLMLINILTFSKWHSS